MMPLSHHDWQEGQQYMVARIFFIYTLIFLLYLITMLGPKPQTSAHKSLQRRIETVHHNFDESSYT